MERTYLLLITTVPNREVADAIASALVGSRLVACVNITSPVASVYHWKGELCRDEELMLFMKTEKSLYQSVEDEIKRLHPYEVPEVVAIPIEAGSGDYLGWITENTRKP